MARLLVVSRNPALAIGLSGAEHDVTDLRPDAFARWIEGNGDVDLLVLDLENPRLAAAAVENLRVHGNAAPVLLVSSDRPGWDDTALDHLAGARVLPLPVSRSVLLAAVDDLIAPPASAPTSGAVHHEAVVEALQELAVGSDALLAVDDEEVPLPAPRHARREPEPTAETVQPPARAATAPEAGSGLSSIPRTQRRARVPAADMTTSLQELQALRASPAARSVSLARRQRPEEQATKAVPAVSGDEPAVDLVRRLQGVVSTLFGVPETAEVVIGDAVERTGADAGALLVPDGDSWRVAAGIGLRPLEHRYRLSTDSWLVDKVGRAHKGVIIEESDVAREQLHGAPLASWRHLLAAPVPEIHAVLLVARREDPPFDERALSLLASIGVEAQPLLTAAVETRQLARALWEFRDEDDSAPR